MKKVMNTAAILACTTGMCMGQDRITSYWSATSDMFEDESLSSSESGLGDFFDLEQFASSPAGADILLGSTVDYDLNIDNKWGSQIQVRTGITGLEIASNGIIRGYNFWMRPYTQGGLNGSFENYGTIRADGGEVRINGTTNYELVHANGGELEFWGDNDGTLLATEDALLMSRVDFNGFGFSHHNYGLIEARGQGAVFQVVGDSSNPQNFWVNSGTVRILESGTGRFGSLRLSDLGIIERDANARIEITGLIDLEGGIIDADTFNGEVWLTDGFPGTEGLERGQLTNGTIDLTGNWLRFGNRTGYISNSQIIGGDLVLDPSVHGEDGSALAVDDITIVDGGIILAENSIITFAEQIPDDNLFYYNQSITTLHNSGEQAYIGVSRHRLHLGTNAVISGHVKLGFGYYSTRNIYNEGLILSTAISGRLDLYSLLQNHGTILIQDNAMNSSGTIENESELVFDHSSINLYSIENNSTFLIINQSTLSLTRDLTLADASDLVIDADPAQTAMTVFGTLTLGGILRIDLSRIVQAGTYQLYSAQTVVGEFDSVTVSALPEGLVFEGLNNDGSYTVSLPCQADLSGDGMLNFLDISAFLSLFSLNDVATDFNNDGQWNFLDISAFLTSFTAGCP